MQPSMGTEMQYISQPQGGQARDMTLPQYTAVLPGGPPDSEDESVKQLRRRVTCISIALGVLIVANSLIQFLFDTAAYDAALQQVQDVAQIPLHVSREIKGSLVSNGISNIVSSILFGLLVPICGYFGTKSSNSSLVGCFCCCNALTSCCSIIGAIACVGVVMGTTAASPRIEHFMEACDPYICLEGFHSGWVDDGEAPDAETRNRVVDCLAAGSWPEYKSLFQAQHPPLHACPTAHFLICGEELEEQKREIQRGKEQWRDGGDARGADWDFAPGSGGNGANVSRRLGVPLATGHKRQAHRQSVAAPFSPMDSMTQAGRGRAGRQAVVTPVGGGRRPGRGAGQAGVAAVSSTAGAPVMFPKRWPQSKSDYAYKKDGVKKPRDWGQKGTRVRGHDNANEEQQWNVVMPEDPMKECEPRYGAVKHFHEAREVLPQLLPKFIFYFLVKALLAIPMVVLACCGFCSGKNLWSRLRSGYAPPSHGVGGIAHYNTYAQPQFNLQAGVVFAQQPADPQMGQSLLMQQHAPSQQPYQVVSAAQPYHLPAQPQVHATQAYVLHAPTAPPPHGTLVQAHGGGGGLPPTVSPEGSQQSTQQMSRQSDAVGQAVVLG